MSQAIDVTGLTPEAVAAVQIMVNSFRETMAEMTPACAYWPGEPPAETAEKWVTRFVLYLDEHPELKGTIEIDDDRGSMNYRDGAN